MKNSDTIKKIDIKNALNAEMSELLALDKAEVNLIADDGTDEYEFDLDIDASGEKNDVISNYGVLSLQEIPIDEWKSIRVSPISLFGDELWNFQSYPHVDKKGARVNFDYINNLGFNLTDKKFLHWKNIAKFLCFYSIPHFNVHSAARSYGSLSTTHTKNLRLFKLFQEESLYLGDPSDVHFKTINDLSIYTIEDFIEKLPSDSMRWELAYQIQVWQKISSQNLLPMEYSINESIISKKTVSNYRKVYDSNSNPWIPIDLDDYSAIINHCISMVGNYSKDIIWLYDTFYPTLVGAFSNPEKKSLHPYGFSTGSENGVLAFKEYQPALNTNKEPWWPLRVFSRSHDNDSGDYISYAQVSSVVASLIDACCVLILVTTGMRRSEVMGLKSGCLSQDAEGYWLTYKVFKTSSASQGDIKKIPIPEITADSIMILERLGNESRKYGNHDYLFATITRQNFGNITHGAYPERATNRVVNIVGADELIHPHRFRKTLAMYMIHLDTRNIELIQSLFSHKSLKMTLKYILSLPGIHDEIKGILIDQNVDILTEVINAAMQGSIGGIGGKRVAKTLMDSPHLKANLNDKFRETITQYVSSLLEEGIKLLHRTNIGICLKTPNVTISSPCDGVNEKAASKLHPNIFACDPFNCRFAVFTEDNIIGLKNEIIFHQKLLLHPFVGEGVRIDSNRRIEIAAKRLQEVIGEEAQHEFLTRVANG